MRGEHDGLARVGEGLGARHEGAPGLDVHADGGLVEEEHVGIATDGQGEVEALALTSGQRGDRASALSARPAMAMARSAGRGDG